MYVTKMDGIMEKQKLPPDAGNLLCLFACFFWAGRNSLTHGPVEFGMGCFGFSMAGVQLRRVLRKTPLFVAP